MSEDKVMVKDIDVSKCPLHRLYYRAVICEGGNRGIIKEYSYNCSENVNCMYKKLVRSEERNKRLLKELNDGRHGYSKEI